MRFPDFNDDWKETTLGEVLIKPQQKAVEDPTNTELITVKLHCKGIVNTGKYPNKTEKGRAYYIRYTGELLIGKQNFHNGGIGIVPHVCSGKICSNAIASYISKDQYIEYIYYYISRETYYSLFEKYLGGTGQKEISASEFNNLPISLPSLAEQKKIADFLSLIDERITNLSETIKELKTQKAGLLNQLFSQKLRFPDFNDEWTQTTLGEVAEMNSGGTPSTSNPIYYGGEIPFLSISDISKCGKYIYKTENYITEEGLKNSSARLFPSETIMFAMYASVGKTAIAKVPISCSQAILGISSIDVNKIFLYYILIIKSKDYSRLSQTGTQMNLSKYLMEKLSISLPTLSEQKKIADFLSLIDERIEVEEQLLKKYEEQKKYLLQNMFV